MSDMQSDGNHGLEKYLLTIRGTLAPPTLEASRQIHNDTAGAPQSVAAARSLGDLSHMVYVPIGQPASQNGAGEFLILDIWNSMDGLGQFFANEHVQEQAGMIFSQRDPVVWAPAPGFYTYNLPAPSAKPARYVALVRGMVSSEDEARRVHNSIVKSGINAAKMAGDMSHEVYFRMAAPDAPERLELCAIDVWYDAEGMNQYYQNPDFRKGLMELFAAPPSTSVWVHPAGDWVEW
jgi:quinol monooxygenase YgiN